MSRIRNLQLGRQLDASKGKGRGKDKKTGWETIKVKFNIFSEIVSIDI